MTNLSKRHSLRLVLRQDGNLYRLFKITTTQRDSSLYIHFTSKSDMAGVDHFRWKKQKERKNLDFSLSKKIPFPLKISYHESGLVRFDSTRIGSNKFWARQYPQLFDYRGQSFMIIDFTNLDCLEAFNASGSENFQPIDVGSETGRVKIILYASYSQDSCQEKTAIKLGSISSTNWDQVLYLYYALNSWDLPLAEIKFVLLGGFPLPENARNKSYGFFGVVPLTDVSHFDP